MREGMSVYTEELALLNVLPTFPVLPSAPTGSTVTEEADLDDNQTALNVTSPELNSFYFYEVSTYFVNTFAATLAVHLCINQSIKQTICPSFRHSVIPSISVSIFIRPSMN
jgi:hypothetical protein